MAPITAEDRAFMADKPYRELLGSIMYAQIVTQPNLSYAVSTLSKFASNPGRAHWNALTHVLRYIKGQSSTGLPMAETTRTSDQLVMLTQITAVIWTTAVPVPGIYLSRQVD